MSVDVKNMQCPSCAGVVEYRPGSPVCRCSYCENRVLFLGTERCPSWFLEPALGKDEAHRCVVDLLDRQGRILPSFLESATWDSARLLYLPLYEVRGTSYTRIEDSAAVGETDTRVQLRDVIYHEFSLRADELGVNRLDLEPLRRGELSKLFRPLELDDMGAERQLFTPDRSPEAVESIFVHREKTERVRRGVRSELLASTVQLIYYPVWVLVYPWEGSLYRFVVDAATGRCIVGRAPEHRIWCCLVAQTLLVLCAAFGTGVLRFFGETGLFRLGTFPAFLAFLACLPPLALLYGVWLRLVHGRDVAVINDTAFLEQVVKRDVPFIEGAVVAVEELVHFVYLSIRSALAGGRP